MRIKLPVVNVKGIISSFKKEVSRTVVTREEYLRPEKPATEEVKTGQVSKEVKEATAMATEKVFGAEAAMTENPSLDDMMGWLSDIGAIKPYENKKEEKGGN